MTANGNDQIGRRLTNLENDFKRVVEEMREIKMLLRRMNAKNGDVADDIQRSSSSSCDLSKMYPLEDSKLIFIFIFGNLESSLSLLKLPIQISKINLGNQGIS